MPPVPILKPREVVKAFEKVGGRFPVSEAVTSS